MRVAILGRPQRGPAPYARRSAMHRSKFDLGGANAGAGGMSISSGSGGAGVRGAGLVRFANSLAEIAIAAGTQWTPPGCPGLVLVKVSDCA